MPASTEEIDHVKLEESSEGKKLSIYSYGLPLMFWGYFLVLIALEFAMYLSISTMLHKLLFSDDLLNQSLAAICIITMAVIPLFAVGMIFYQKVLIRCNNTLNIEFRIFGLKLRSRKFRFDQTKRDRLEVTHLLESPNMARIQKNTNTRAFENQGHYILTLWSKDRPYFIDRHTRKHDLVKLSKLITDLS